MPKKLIEKFVELRVSGALEPYQEAVAFMERRVGEIHIGAAPETLWLLEHPPLYTAGTSAADGELLDPGRFPVFQTGRGGRYTYHGPGQRVAYVMLDLSKRGNDVRAFVHSLEDLVIAALDQFGVKAETRAGRIGIWVDRGQGREEKVAAIGIRVRRWVAYHGVAINVDPDLSHFSGITPCGISNHGVTSLKALGVACAMEEVDRALISCFEDIFKTPIKIALKDDL
ncbi:MAG TPA: lipoyl(octanoyl) transferase LipB [Rhodospirillales bacterium]|nr:lipoyl(octanoyl) transferase LipB [Rhodospirillales bacterium]